MGKEHEFLILNKSKTPLFHTTLDSLMKSPMVNMHSKLFCQQLLLNISMMDKGDIIKVSFEKNQYNDALLENNSYIYIQKTND
jgi:hypothetical protein